MKFSKGAQRIPIFAFVYSPPGVGKTTFASGAPKPYFVDAEKGSLYLDVDRAEPESWDELMQLCNDILSGKVAADNQTIVFDTLTKIEEFLHQKLFWSIGTTYEMFDGGWGHGKGALMAEFRKFFSLVERIAKQKNVLILSHAKVKEFKDPKGAAYDRYQPALTEELWQTVHKQVSYTMFACHETSTKKSDDGKKRTLGLETGARILQTNWSASAEVKNRTQYPLPNVIMLSWAEFEGAINAGPAMKAELLEKITAMLKEIGDEAYEKTVTEFLEKNKDSSARLVEIANRVTRKLEEKK